MHQSNKQNMSSYGLSQAFRPLARQSLRGNIVQHIRRLIQEGVYDVGDRLPSIAEMARVFGVGSSAVREAIATLQGTGELEVRHGSGVFVTPAPSSAEVRPSVPEANGAVQLLCSVLRARIPLELQAVELAAVNAPAAEIRRLRAILEAAEAFGDDEQAQRAARARFHTHIARISGKRVIYELLSVFHALAVDETGVSPAGVESPELQREEHLQILLALEARDAPLAVEKMRRHLARIEAALLAYAHSH
jgi:GntR family transcriptional regulator, transcriptional repressor for pyruvate dehydrogenase complex